MIIAVVIIWSIAALAGILLLAAVTSQRKNIKKDHTYMRHGIRVRDKNLKKNYADRINPVGKDDFQTLVLGKGKVENAEQQEWMLRMENMRDNVRIRAYFTNEIIIGRKKSEKEQGFFLQINDSQISRRHCKIICNNSGCYLEDLASKNHTYLDGREVSSCVPVINGAIIEIGREKYRVTLIKKGRLEQCR
ncbi:MAG: FHA domain-containing protein [Lachnospiraceae bacterium]|nr:FHA domain-containing protein [Lachnospiraceae bacterium]